MQNLVPRYAMDITPPRLRGMVGAYAQMALGLGVLSSNLMGLPYASQPPSYTVGTVRWWRIMCIVPAGIALVQFALGAICPESPRYLRWRGRQDAAE